MSHSKEFVVYVLSGEETESSDEAFVFTQKRKRSSFFLDSVPNESSAAKKTKIKLSKKSTSAVAEVLNSQCAGSGIEDVQIIDVVSGGKAVEQCIEGKVSEVAMVSEPVAIHQSLCVVKEENASQKPPLIDLTRSPPTDCTSAGQSDEGPFSKLQDASVHLKSQSSPDPQIVDTSEGPINPDVARHSPYSPAQSIDLEDSDADADGDVHGELYQNQMMDPKVQALEYDSLYLGNLLLQMKIYVFLMFRIICFHNFRNNLHN